MRMLFLTAALTLAVPLAAHAASSDWLDVEGARVRLLTTGAPDAAGKLKGALQIDLKPGWKTYWRDPGSSGVPPDIDVSSTPMLAKAQIMFPAPEWHDEGGGDIWAGYDEPVVLPVEFEMRASGSLDRLQADVFLGVCQTICIPVKARLSLNPKAGAENADEAALIEAALHALPGKATDSFGAKLQAMVKDKAIFELRVPPGVTKIEFFVAGEQGYMFSPPRAVPTEKGIAYISKLITRPKITPAGPGIAYTLSTTNGAVSGYLPYF